MRRLVTGVITATAAACAATAGAAFAAPVNVTAFSISPSCTHPGGTVTATATVQNTTLLPQSFYGEARTSYFGVPVQTSTYGPYTALPLLSVTQSASTQIPYYAPWGSYSVVFGIGPSSGDPMGWSTSTSGFTVAPWC
jgi:hypothetical protein